MRFQERLLVVLAHPDDETFICGGTLAKISKRGGHVTLLCATKGEMGRRFGNPSFATRESLPKLRELELKSACEELGIHDLRYLHVRDKTVEFEDVDFLVESISKVIQEVQPQVILTFHEKYGGHPDHCAIGRAATLAFVKSVNKNSSQNNHKIDISSSKPQRLYFVLWHAFYSKVMNENDLNDITKVNISETLLEKIQALRAHRSQTMVFPELWNNKNSDLPFLEEYEYFLQGNDSKSIEETDLFQTIDRNQ